MKGCHVIGTTSSDEKGYFLKSIGVDYVINYKNDDFSHTLKQHYPKGVDVIWNSIGGETTNILFNHLATRGRLVIVGGISGYMTEGMPNVIIDNLPSRVLYPSLSINGFLVYNHADQFPEYWTKLLAAMSEGNIRMKVDDGATTAGGPFIGLTDAERAVQHLLSGKMREKSSLGSNEEQTSLSEFAFQKMEWIYDCIKSLGIGLSHLLIDQSKILINQPQTSVT